MGEPFGTGGRSINPQTGIDGFVKSLNNLSFRVKREIFSLQHLKNIRFLPMVEMTHSLNLTFYKAVSIPDS